MKYEAIIFDLDGTTIPNRDGGMPSDRLINDIEKIRGTVSVCAATGRPIADCIHILQAMGLTAPCVMSGGTQIVDPRSRKILWEKQLSQDQVAEILRVCEPFNCKMYFSDEQLPSFPKGKIAKPENMVYVIAADKKDMEPLLDGLRKIPDVGVHTAPSWTIGYLDIHITHREATKKGGLERLLKMIGVPGGKVVGFGDGGNDVPLFEVVGYRVAMSTAPDTLKSMANEVALSVEEDGVARVIEELFLN